MIPAVTRWLDPLGGLFGGFDRTRLADLAEALDGFALDPHSPAGPYRSRRLLHVRCELARRGHLDTTDRSPLFRTAAQFVCGYRDVDLRDAVGLGHGLLVARHGGPSVRERWLPRLRAGELAGIAITEPHGGSRVARTRTRAVPAPDGTWSVSGRKTWISRLTEAAVLVVFFRGPDGRLAAAPVAASEPGLRRREIRPSGLAGWSWGTLDLDDVPIHPEDVLHGDGMTLLRNHFAAYRPLVTATALGGAACVFDAVAAGLAARRTGPDPVEVRDSALVTLGRAHTRLVTALLGAVAASHLAEGGHEVAEPWNAASKSYGVDVANAVVTDLAPLAGAAAFRADGRIAKIRRDLDGLRWADGVHDALLRAAGKHHVDAAG